MFSFDESVCFDLDLIQRYDGRGPRYTSYPTALQFSDQLTVRDYVDNAAASNATGVPLSLYVHIPFCHTLCYYCGCNKIITRNQQRVSKYMATLHREIELQAKLFDPSRAVEQLHLGGGTPTYLDEPQMTDLLEKIGKHFTLDQSETRQFSIEVDPRTISEDGIHVLTRQGFNRLSLGIQDFDATVQEAVNRRQSVPEVAALVRASRLAGFNSISFDLIYGLPHQTVSSFDKTLDSVIDMRPDRFAVYNYAHLPQRFKGQRMINAADIPAAEVKLDILENTIERLTCAGYVYIGMDHFALPDDELVVARRNGTLQRNFQGYSTHRHCDLIGLGVSSIGSIGNMFAQSSTSTLEYEMLIKQGTLPIRKGIVVDDDDQLRAAVIQSLMCYDELVYDDFNQQHDVDFRRYFGAEIKRLEPLAKDQLVTLGDRGIRITAKGRLLLRNIAMTFDRYMRSEENENRFSKAI